MGDMEFFQQRFRFFYFLLLTEILACLQKRHQVIPDGHLSEYGGFLRQVADPELVALVDGHPGNGTPVYGHIALIRLDDADDHIEGGRLAGPVRSKETDDGALLDFYIHMIDDGAAARLQAVREAASAWAGWQEELADGALAARGLIDAEGLAQIGADPFLRQQYAPDVKNTVEAERWMTSWLDAGGSLTE